MPKLSRAARLKQETTDIDSLFPLPRSVENPFSPQASDSVDSDSEPAQLPAGVEVAHWFKKVMDAAATGSQVKMDVKTSGKVKIEIDLSALANQYENIVRSGKVRQENLAGFIANEGFLTLPYEIRQRVYRMVFCTEAPIGFSDRREFGRTAALLRTCKTVYTEGLVILYGENSFHFRRSTGSRGTYYEEHWEDIGYSDVLRFLKAIGTKALSMMRFVSFSFEDATISQRPQVTTEQRRFVNDRALLDVLDLFGKHTILNKLAVTFYGRAAVTYTDVYFLRALAHVKCRDLLHVRRFAHQSSRIKDDLFSTLERVMVVETPDDGKPNDKIYGRKVYMMYEWPLDRPVGWL